MSSITEVNRTIGVRLGSITERPIDYGGRMKFQLNSVNAWHSQTLTSISLFAGRQETPGTFTFASLLKVSSPTVP